MTQCPSCHVPLRLVVESEIDIDVCDECQGVWLDPGELESLSSTVSFVPRQFDADEVLDLKCPRCNTRGFAQVIHDLGEFARCADCGGVFVGGATLDTIASSEKRPKSGQLLPTKETAIMTADLLTGVAELLRAFVTR